MLKIKAAINPGFIWGMTSLKMMCSLEPPFASAVSSKRSETPSINPFNIQTTITYSLPSKSFVSLEVFDILGRRVALLQNGEQYPGIYKRSWDAKTTEGLTLSSGIYFTFFKALNLENPDDVYQKTSKIVLIK